MNTEHDKQEKTDRYVLNELSGNELTDFEKNIQEDNSLQEDVILTKHISNAFQKKGERAVIEEIDALSSEEEMKAILASAEKKYQSGAQTKRVIMRITATAAVILALIYVGISPRYSTQNLFEAYYSAEMYEPIPHRGEVLPIVQQQEQELYDAVCLINSKQINEAIEKLEKMSSSPEFIFREDAEWNLALAYLNNNQRNKAQNILLKIAEKNENYAGEAKELLEKLNMKKWF